MSSRSPAMCLCVRVRVRRRQVPAPVAESRGAVPGVEDHHVGAAAGVEVRPQIAALGALPAPERRPHLCLGGIADIDHVLRVEAEYHRAMILAGSEYPGFGPFIRPTSRLGEEHTT